MASSDKVTIRREIAGDLAHVLNRVASLAETHGIERVDNVYVTPKRGRAGFTAGTDPVSWDVTVEGGPSDG